MSSLRSRTISRLAARSSGFIERIASDMPGDVLVEDLLAQPVDELVEAPARVRLEEVVVLEPADPPAHVGRQRIELVEPAGGHVAQHRPHRRIGGRIPPPGPSPGRRVRRRVRRAGGLRGCRRGTGLPDAASRRRSTPRPLLLDDLVELAPDVGQDVAELVALEELLAPPLEPVHQVAQAGQVAPRRVARPPAPLHQPPEGLGQVALLHDVVGEGGQDLVRVQVRDLLAAVPARVARPRGRAVRDRAATATVAARAARSRGSGE